MDCPSSSLFPGVNHYEASGEISGMAAASTDLHSLSNPLDAGSPPGPVSSNSLINNSHNVVQNFITQNISYSPVGSTSALGDIQTQTQGIGEKIRCNRLSEQNSAAALGFKFIAPSVLASIKENDGDECAGLKGLSTLDPDKRTQPSQASKDARTAEEKKGTYPPRSFEHVPSKAYSTRSSIGSRSLVSAVRINLVKGRANDIELPKETHKDIKAYMLADMGSLGPASEFTVRLWDPYRNLNLDRKLQEQYCTLGDVGIFCSDGGFDVRFNIFLSKEENQKMEYKPPENFEPIAIDGYEVRKPRLTTEYYITTDFQRKKEEFGKRAFTFESVAKPKSTAGVLLVLPQGCSKRTIRHEIIQEIGCYLNDHTDMWDDPRYSSDLENGSLKLITTSYTSTVWGAAALRKNKYQESERPHYQAQLKRTGEPSTPNVYQWQTHKSMQSTRSSNEEVDNLLCTVAVEVHSLQRSGFPRGSTSQVFSSLVSSSLGSRSSLASTSRSSIRSIFSARRRC